MTDVEITLRLPQALVERAKVEGIVIDDASVTKMIETEFIRAQAVRVLRDAMQKLEGSMTPEEIEAELAAAREYRKRDSR